MHAPPSQAKPGLHAPSQHGSLAAPQPPQTPVEASQTLPASHRSPAQQRSPLAPQPAEQSTPVQTAVPEQVRPAQHGWPGMPQSTDAQRPVSVSQIKPDSQTAPAQQP